MAYEYGSQLIPEPGDRRKESYREGRARQTNRSCEILHDNAQQQPSCGKTASGWDAVTTPDSTSIKMTRRSLGGGGGDRKAGERSERYRRGEPISR